VSVDHLKRLASEILGVGVSRIWIDPTKHNELVTVITREEVKKLIEEGVIRVKPKKGNSRVRARIRHLKKKKGRRRGPGKRKGPRFDEKEIWVAKIRAMRRYLKELRARRKISPRTYRRLYRLAKGGYFRSLSHLKAYIEEHKLLER